MDEVTGKEELGLGPEKIPLYYSRSIPLPYTRPVGKPETIISMAHMPLPSRELDLRKSIISVGSKLSPEQIAEPYLTAWSIVSNDRKKDAAGNYAECISLPPYGERGRDILTYFMSQASQAYIDQNGIDYLVIPSVRQLMKILKIAYSGPEAKLTSAMLMRVMFMTLSMVREEELTDGSIKGREHMQEMFSVEYLKGTRGNIAYKVHYTKSIIKLFGMQHTAAFSFNDYIGLRSAEQKDYYMLLCTYLERMRYYQSNEATLNIATLGYYGVAQPSLIKNERALMPEKRILPRQMKNILEHIKKTTPEGLGRYLTISDHQIHISIRRAGKTKPKRLSENEEYRTHLHDDVLELKRILDRAINGGRNSKIIESKYGMEARMVTIERYERFLQKINGGTIQQFQDATAEEVVNKIGDHWEIYKEFRRDLDEPPTRKTNSKIEEK